MPHRPSSQSPALPNPPGGASFGRRTLLGGLGAIGLAASQTPSAFAAGQEGDTLTFVLVSEPVSLVSHSNVFTPVLSVSAKVTEGLLEYDQDLNPVPMLATAWSVTPDGLRYTFTLRQGVKWHDGKDFTSADVAFAIMLLRKIHPRGRSTFANVVSVGTPDDHTAVVELSKPAPFLIKALAGAETPIIPKHIYENTDPLTNPNNVAPIGTGPFIFKEWVRGSHIRYARNPDYWGTGKPKVDQLIVRIITDPAARSAAFETGQVELGYRTPVGMADVARLRKSGSLVFDTKGAAYSYNVTRLEFNLDNPFFRDIRVRQAVAHAVNRELICKVVYYGLAIPCATAIPVGLKQFHDPSPSPYPFDLARAQALLDQAGYPRGPDGVRFRIPLDFNPASEDGPRLADFFRSMLDRIGIVAEVRAQDIGTFIKRIYTNRDFAMTTNGASSLFDPTVGIQRLYWSKNYVKGVPFSNGTHYANPEVDTLLEGASSENDPAKRIAMFKKFQEIVAHDVPDLNLVQPVFLTMYNKRVHDATIYADGVESNLGEVHLDG